MPLNTENELNSRNIYLTLNTGHNGDISILIFHQKHAKI